MDMKKEDEIKIDPETGLPELPEGYRWNVTDEFPADGSYFGPTPTYKSTTKLRVIVEELTSSKVSETEKNPKKRWWNWEPRYINVVKRKDKWVYCHGAETTEVSAESVLTAAKAVMSALARDATRARLIGVYPPKKLEVEA